MVYGKQVTIDTRGDSDIVNITEPVREIVRQSRISNGIVAVFAVGSTASVSTIEFEPALVADMRDHLERFAPRRMHARHGETWGDDNGYAHIRATFMGPGITIPVCDAAPVLGTWQQIIVIDHDNRPRSRTIFVQVIGE